MRYNQDMTQATNNKGNEMNASQARIENDIQNGLTMQSGSRIAKISKQHGRYNVYVGFAGGSSIPGEETIPARFFKGNSTCSQTFATANNAVRAANKFLGTNL